MCTTVHFFGGTNSGRIREGFSCMSPLYVWVGGRTLAFIGAFGYGTSDGVAMSISHIFETVSIYRGKIRLKWTDCTV